MLRIPTGDLQAADAHFLANELRTRGINAKVRRTGIGSGDSDRAYTVLVPADVFTRACAVRDEVLPEIDEETEDEPERKPDKWGQASLAGGLGLLVGLRLGARLKEPLMTLALALAFGGGAFAATLYFHRNKHGTEDA